MLTDNAAVLAELDAVGPNWNHRARISTGRPTALALTEYLSVSKRTRQVLETVAGVPEAARRLGVGAGTAWKPSNGPA
jgi:hypothetical protein